MLNRYVKTTQMPNWSLSWFSCVWSQMFNSYRKFSSQPMNDGMAIPEGFYESVTKKLVSIDAGSKLEKCPQSIYTMYV
jgi:hypothetical protein